jgi:transketolase
VAAGITVFEALKAYDALKADGIDVRIVDLYSLQPVDAATLAEAARETHRFVTVEDHYAAGGVGDAVLDRYGISAARIVEAVRTLLR